MRTARKVCSFIHSFIHWGHSFIHSFTGARLEVVSREDTVLARGVAAWRHMSRGSRSKQAPTRDELRAALKREKEGIVIRAVGVGGG